MMNRFASAVFIVLASSTALAGAQEIIFTGAGGNGVRAVEAKIPEIEKAFGVKVVMRIYSADLGVTNLVRGAVHGFVGPNLKKSMERLSKEGKFAAQDISDYDSALVSYNPILLGTNPGHFKSPPTREQLVEILSGKIKTWKTLDGSDDPIVILITLDKPSQRELIEKNYLGGAKINGEMVKDYEGQLRALKRHPGGIIIASESRPGSDGFQPQFFKTEVGHNTYLYVKKDAPEHVHKALAHLKNAVSGK